MKLFDDTIRAELKRDKHRLAALQALRMMIACALTYGLAQVLGLHQGYWAVFTVLIVMQGTVGATAVAAVDRLYATVLGAGVGGLAVLVTPHHPLATGISLILAVGLASFATAQFPKLRSAGVTAAIVILTRSPDMPVLTFVVDRILEITLGGVIGVIASRVVLPVQSRTTLLERLGSVLDKVAEVLRAQAGVLEKGDPLPPAESYIGLRQSLVAIDTLLTEARREHRLLLARHGIADAIPRTLWRVRNDVVHIGSLLETPFSAPVADAVNRPAAEFLRAEADFAELCREALTAEHTASATQDHPAAEAFEAALADLRDSQAAAHVHFDEIGRLFGLSFVLRRLRQNLHDLLDRIDEG